ncbi:MAG: methionine--tRNA ligase [Pseudomonadota bacterium]
MRHYITTPIYYVNAEPHIGHTYSTLVADAITRFRRLTGEEAIFSTGTDEHGDKIAEAAAKKGTSPKEYADRISNVFRNTWPQLNIRPDRFIRTTDPNHIQAVHYILNKVHAQGDIYFGEYGGLYCTGCERFYMERELVDGKCPDHRIPPVMVKEENYFFRMSRYQEWLINHIQSSPDFIKPERYRNEVLSFLNEPLEDLCISRPRSRLEWGISLPFDDRFVTYVWFDALINYVSVLGYPDGDAFEDFWPVAEHIIAKDILKPHAIYWPTMLRAAGIEPYRTIHVHGYWNINETKMSKSLGNVVRPLDLTRAYGVDAVRYFLLREMAFGIDAGFSEEALRARHNSDLANDLGNLFSRALTMIEKYCDSTIPQPEKSADIDTALKDHTLRTSCTYKQDFDSFAFHKALAQVWEVISLTNKYIVQTAPWELAKKGDRERLQTVLYYVAEVLRIIAVWISPVMPDTTQKMMTALGCSSEKSLTYADTMVWGILPVGQPIKKGPALFPRLGQEEAAGTEPGKPEKKETPVNLIDISEFKKTELLVAEVLAAESVPKSEKLLKLTVSADRRRTIVAGIASCYKPEEIVGKQVIIAANLKPAKLMGVESEGMVLAARDETGVRVLTVDKRVKPGSKVS